MREPLTRERVLAAAVALADAEGMPALTMRRLATDLGVEAMSLYYHLPGKNSLLDGLLESVVSEIDAAVAASDAKPADPGEEWRATLRRWFLTAREVMLRHSWAPGLMGRGRALPPGLYLYYERILAHLVSAGFSYRIAHRALHAFGSMPLGFVQELFGSGAEDQASSSEDELAAMAEALPHLAAMVAAELHDVADPTLGWCDSQVEFQFTLDLLLDGLERSRRAEPTPEETPVSTKDETALPKLSAPARRALEGAGLKTLQQLTEVSEAELRKLHGMGPNALATLRAALDEHGLSFRA